MGTTGTLDSNLVNFFTEQDCLNAVHHTIKGYISAYFGRPILLNFNYLFV